ncbi:hypothetical protein TWF173_011380 [Orbilia oligospora]|nr:hypothetical protein TWF173_011380 [Orbilia oligospora]
MLARARENLAKSPEAGNITFIEANITSIPLDNSVADCIISNCVINLVPEADKPAAFVEMARILKPGGRVAISDILARKTLPPSLKKDVTLYAGCIAGAATTEGYKQFLKDAGFSESDLNIYVNTANLLQGSNENAAGCCRQPTEAVDSPTGEKAIGKGNVSCCSQVKMERQPCYDAAVGGAALLWESNTDAPSKTNLVSQDLETTDSRLNGIDLNEWVGVLLGNFVEQIGPSLQKAWAFLPDKSDLRTGLILVGLGRCIAMVLIWNDLAAGDENYCAILVVVNSVLQMVLFAPLAVLFIKVISGSGELELSYSTIATNVAVFLGIPLGAAILTRLLIRQFAGPDKYEVFLKWLSPWSLIGLLYTVLVLFASQGRQVVHQIVSVVRVAAPLIVYFVAIFIVTLYVTYRLGFGYKLGVTQSFTAASNNFELAIAVAVATFGPNSDQALASTVGPLIEVPVLIALVVF